MNKIAWAAGLPVLAIVAAIGVLTIPNPLGEQVLAEAKYRGYIAYTADEAVSLAYKRCSTCHTADKMTLYCSRCGPPFIVTVHSMKKYVDLMNQKGGNFRPFSDAEAVAIVQAWNALVGNWEHGWGLTNINKLLQGDRALMRLAETPLEQRPIEMALKGKQAPGTHKETSDGIPGSKHVGQ